MKWLPSRYFSIFSDDTFSLRYKLSLPGVSHSIIENICSSLAETAKDVLLLERNCGGSIMKNSPIYLAFCRSMMETIRLHRTLVLKLGTVKSLPLFVKMTRRCCGGIRFIRYGAKYYWETRLKRLLVSCAVWWMINLTLISPRKIPPVVNLGSDTFGNPII